MLHYAGPEPRDGQKAYPATNTLDNERVYHKGVPWKGYAAEKRRIPRKKGVALRQPRPGKICQKYEKIWENISVLGPGLPLLTKPRSLEKSACTRGRTTRTAGD